MKTQLKTILRINMFGVICPYKYMQLKNGFNNCFCVTEHFLFLLWYLFSANQLGNLSTHDRGNDKNDNARE